jgi:hypothetical protein
MFTPLGCATPEVCMKVKEAMHKGVKWVGPDTPSRKSPN